MKHKRKLLNIIISLSLLLILWQLLSLFGEVGKTSIPSPLEVVKAIKDMIEDKILFKYIGISLYRFAVGYFIAAIFAIALGLIFGWYKKAWDIIDPIVQVLRPVSPIAWFPFIVIIFGIGNLPAIVIIFIAAFFPILLSTVTAVKNIEKSYLKVASNFEIKGLKLMGKIVLPAIFPYIANAMHIALGSAWVFLVAGEMVGAQSGLGYLIIDARNNLRLDMLMAGIIFIGLIGLILDKLIARVERKIGVKWGRTY
ncbi:ABC transporter permease [Clostridium cellulovorans]|uniref:Binding-protein-dependent transport systems inner membrane component n=1 Tax=Clostridium cellulovorans (strain ATCC 35296 / DSM 3052 / OCM 3 / 743B) TaxID=573061 RepID=D9SQ76_CLOC7|nr:ABC transporter permease [Clostridium cellulovorans]ADL50143.1 binding-protein-dependent transport systems inner membrane component [Clostridium cellulovorans 743B]